MGNYYEALRKIKSSGKLKKPRSKIRDRGKVDLEDLIREAEELDAKKGRLSEEEYHRILGIRNDVSNRLLGERVSLDDFIDEVVDSLMRPTRPEKAPDYRGILPKHMQKMNPTSIIRQAKDQKFNRKRRDRRSLAREAARENYNRLPSRRILDPKEMEEAELLVRQAEEDSRERVKDLLEKHLAENKAEDYVHGPDQDTMLSVMEEAIKPKHMTDIISDSDTFKKRAVAEAVASGDINKIIDVYPFVQDNEAAKAAIEEMVARTKNPAKAFALEKRVKVNPDELDIPGMDLDIKLREALDKLGGEKEIIDEASVGGFSNDVVPELANLSIADDQIFGNELFDMKLKDRTRDNRAYDSSFDKFLTQEGVDVSQTDRYNRAVLDEMIRLAKRQQAVDSNGRLYARRHLHEDPVMRDKIDDRGTLPVEVIEAYKNRAPGKSEQFLNYLRSAYAKEKSKNPKAKHHAIMKSLANEWVPNRKGFGMIDELKSGHHPGNPRGNARVAASDKPTYLETLETKRDKLMAELENARSRGNEDAVSKLTKALDNVNDEIIVQKDYEKSIEINEGTDMIMDHFENPSVIEARDPTPSNESMAWHNELDYHDEQAAKKGWHFKKQTDEEINSQLVKDAARLGNRDRYVPVYKGSMRYWPTAASEKETLRSMWRKKKHVDKSEIPLNPTQKVRPPLTGGGMTYSERQALEARFKRVDAIADMIEENADGTFNIKGSNREFKTWEDAYDFAENIIDLA